MTADSLAVFDRAGEAAAFVRSRVGSMPDVVVVLGSGLGGFAESLGGRIVLPYREIPHWPTPSVAGHAGDLVVGECGGRRVAVYAGRSHIYEGGTPTDVTFGVRVAGVLGVRTLVLTNAAGGLNPDFAVGDLMAIDDHINLMGRNPLIGPNDDRFGPRFPDMTAVYARRLRDAADSAALSTGPALRHGVYLAVTGPNYETPAEIRAFRSLGADAVGMSTVPEALVARHMGLEVLGLSCITNMAAGLLPQPLDANEVLDAGARVRPRLSALLEALLARI